MNNITIKVSGSLKQHLAEETIVQNVHTVGEAITSLNLPESGEMLLLVNGKLAYWNTQLQDGDVLQLVPAISGG